MHYALFGLARV